jgi:hypothetical protein
MHFNSTCIHHVDFVSLGLLGLRHSVERLHRPIHVLIIANPVLAELSIDAVSFSDREEDESIDAVQLKSS